MNKTDIFYVDVQLNKSALYLMSGFLHVLKSLHYTHISEDTDFMTNPWYFQYLLINPEKKEYHFVPTTGNSNAINLENHWSEILDKMI